MAIDGIGGVGGHKNFGEFKPKPKVEKLDSTKFETFLNLDNKKERDIQPSAKTTEMAGSHAAMQKLEEREKFLRYIEEINKLDKDTD
ncbi:hypothetical protein [Rossellomorea sp. RS05]|uniref:hypothetical protein n=1 Tax=Rossellomorea sp. RS05 TaxID=3149166 RepID=UPI003221FD30